MFEFCRIHSYTLPRPIDNRPTEMGLETGKIFTGVTSSTRFSTIVHSTVSTVMKMATVLQKSLPSDDNIKRLSQVLYTLIR